MQPKREKGSGRVFPSPEGCLQAHSPSRAGLIGAQQGSSHGRCCPRTVKVTTGPCHPRLRPIAFSFLYRPWQASRVLSKHQPGGKLPCQAQRYEVAAWMLELCAPGFQVWLHSTPSSCVTWGKWLSFLGLSLHLHSEAVPLSDPSGFAVPLGL